MEVRLTVEEWQMANTVGRWRMALYSSRAEDHRYERGERSYADQESLHKLGARGELAVAKGLNLFWSGMLGLKAVPDIGFRYEVRCRSTEADLPIKGKRDKLELPHILVWQLDRPLFRLVGWLTGHEAIACGEEHAGVHYAPHRLVRPLGELP